MRSVKDYAYFEFDRYFTSFSSVRALVQYTYPDYQQFSHCKYMPVKFLLNRREDVSHLDIVHENIAIREINVEYFCISEYKICWLGIWTKRICLVDQTMWASIWSLSQNHTVDSLKKREEEVNASIPMEENITASNEIPQFTNILMLCIQPVIEIHCLGHDWIILYLCSVILTKSITRYILSNRLVLSREHVGMKNRSKSIGITHPTSHIIRFLQSYLCFNFINKIFEQKRTLSCSLWTVNIDFWQLVLRPLLLEECFFWKIC